jgi:hypothetical protein
MVCQEPDSIKPELFRTELVKCLADYSEKIRYMEGAGGLRVAKSFKRKVKEIGSAPQKGPCPEGEGGGAGIRMK